MEGLKVFYVTYIAQIRELKNILCDICCTNGRGKKIFYSKTAQNG